MQEIELKARVADPRAVEGKLALFMDFKGTIDKHDEYWTVPVMSSVILTTGFRFRIRKEPGKATVTFKEKTYTSTIEINNEVEFGVLEPAAFQSFIEKMSAKLLYTKHKAGTQWKSEAGLLAELVRVEGLGDFLEVEAMFEDGNDIVIENVKNQLIDVIKRCGLTMADIEPRPYSQLLGMPRY